MNYENKYKEALERARIWKEKSGMPKDKQSILDNIFPELAESEDERIRKKILEHIQLCTESIPDRDKFIAWLEKQGEKLPVGFYYVNSDGKKFYSDTLKYGNVTLHVEKQDKQKSWSEEDEENMEKILDAIGSYYYLTTDDDILCDWLKSLKQRIEK